MSNFKFALLSAGAMIAGAMGVTGTAQAQQIYGGGASLPAPYIRAAADCYGIKTNLIFFGSPPTTVSIPDFNFTGVPAFNCATTTVQPAQTINYISTGSGRGIRGFFSSDETTFWGDTDPVTAGVQPYPDTTFAMSDAGLGTADVNAYNNGGTPPAAGGVTVVAPLAVASPPASYRNPREFYGPMIQVPALIAPVAIAFDPVYKKVRNGDGSITEYKFNINPTIARADGSGGLRLNVQAYCGIFNGVGPNNQGPNWNVGWLRSLNRLNSSAPIVSLADPADPAAATFNVPMQIVGRSDSSGTTSIFTRHLAAACSAFGYNQYTDGSTTLPAGLQGPAYNKANPNFPAVAGEVATKFTRADGNDGVAKYLDFTQDPGPTAGDTVQQGRIGYVGPDFALPYVTNTASNTFGLQTADLRNAATAYVAPSPQSALNAFQGLLPPQSNANGTYNPLVGTKLRSNPQDWVEPTSFTSPLANPSNSSAYPIVGTSNFLAYTCYRSTNNGYTLRGFLDWYYNSPTVTNTSLGILASSGFGPMPSAWRTAIRETFTTGTAGLPLRIIRKSDAAYCNSAYPVGINGAGA